VLALTLGYLASFLVSLLGGAVLALAILMAAGELIGRLDRSAAIREIPELATVQWRRRRFLLW